jgi:hypothetical protein
VLGDEFCNLGHTYNASFTSVLHFFGEVSGALQIAKTFCGTLLRAFQSAMLRTPSHKREEVTGGYRTLHDENAGGTR